MENMKKIDIKTINSYKGKPREKQLEIAIGDNLWLFVTKTGSCIFRYRVYFTTNLTIDGKIKVIRNWITIGEYPAISLARAKYETATFNNYKQQGINPIDKANTEVINGVSVSSLISDYETNQLRSVRKVGNSLRKATYNLNYIKKILGNHVLGDLKRVVIFDKLIQPKLDEALLAAARDIFSQMKVLLNYAVKLDHIETNPLSAFTVNDINLPNGIVRKGFETVGKERERVLSEDELRTVFSDVYGAKIYLPIKIAIHLLLMLGFRKGELLNIKWSDIDFEQSLLSISVDKVSKPLTTKIPAQAIKLLKILQIVNGRKEYVFCMPTKNTRMAYTIINKWLTELFVTSNKLTQNLTVHDLRRTFATSLADLDFDRQHIEFQLGHSLMGSQKHYYHAEFLEQRAVMLQSWADKLDGFIPNEVNPYNKLYTRSSICLKTE